MTLFAFLLLVFGLTIVGRALLAALRPFVGMTPLERNLIGFALGLGLLAYGMLTLGLLGRLYFIYAAFLMSILVSVGWKQQREVIREAREAWRGRGKLTANGVILGSVFAAFAVIALIGDFTPPIVARWLDVGLGYTEWDSIAYHLADPKLYVQAHRIYYLPWESHSNFAFTVEMWYAFALLWHSVPLAKLLHFGCGVGTCLTIYAFGARHLTPRVGKLAALLFASTPLVFWEAGTAYVDLAATFYATLTLLALTNSFAPPAPNPGGARVEEGLPHPTPPNLGVGGLPLAAILMGLTLSCKATALTTLAIFALGLLVWQVRRFGVAKSVKTVAAWCVLALVVGSPWYVKSFVYTGNPVYPFFFGIFGGRFWDAAAAGAYNASQAAFGVGRSVLNALLLPWNVTMVKQSFNDFPTPLASLSPVPLAALFFPVFARRSAPPLVRALGLYALASLAVWFVTMQYLRYLLPLLPIFCLLTAWATRTAWEEKWLAGKALMGLTVASIAWGLWIGGSLAVRQLPVVFGRETRDDYIAHGYRGYPAMQFINTELSSNTKLVFYGHPFGFYSNREYLWGEAGHSTFIPYTTMHDAEDLRKWLTQNGVTHILLDLNDPRAFALTPGSGTYTGWLYELTVGRSAPIFERRGIGIWHVPGARP